MKKYVIQIIVAVIVSTAIVGTYYYFTYVNAPGKNRGGNDDLVTVTDADGNTYIAVFDEEGNTYVAVTDADGSVYAAVTDAQGNVGEAVTNTKGEKQYITDYSASDLPENTTVPNASGNQGTTEVNGQGGTTTTTAPGGQSGTTTTTTPGGQSSTTTTTTPGGQSSTTTTTAPGGQSGTTTTTAPGGQSSTTTTTTPGGQSGVTTTQPSMQNLRAEKYVKMFESGTYRMEFTMEDEELGNTPIVVASKGGNILMSTTLMSIDCTMLYLAKDQTGYLLFDDYKKYCKLPEDLSSTMDEVSSAISDNGYKSVTTSEVSIDGQNLHCEAYTQDDGTVTRYYFNDADELVRHETVSTDGTMSVMYITSITSDVPDSTFEIPDNYGYYNFEWAGFLFNGMS